MNDIPPTIAPQGGHAAGTLAEQLADLRRTAEADAARARARLLGGVEAAVHMLVAWVCAVLGDLLARHQAGTLPPLPVRAARRSADLVCAEDGTSSTHAAGLRPDSASTASRIYYSAEPSLHGAGGLAAAQRRSAAVHHVSAPQAAAAAREGTCAQSVTGAAVPRLQRPRAQARRRLSIPPSSALSPPSRAPPAPPFPQKPAISRVSARP